jgi:hypothetical protein
VIHAEAPENLFNSFEQCIGDVSAAFEEADEAFERGDAAARLLGGARNARDDRQL